MTKEQYVAMVEAWPRKEILKLFRAARITAHDIKTNRELAERLWLRIGQYRHKETRANPMRYKMIDRAAPKRNPLSRRDSLIRLARISADEYAYAKGHYAAMPHEKRSDRRKAAWVKMQDLYREMRARKGAMVRARRLARKMHRAAMQHDVDRGDFDTKDVKLVEMLKRGGYLRNPQRRISTPDHDFGVILDLGVKTSTVRVVKAPWRGWTQNDAWTGTQPKTILWVDFNTQTEAKAAYKSMTKAKIETLLRK